MEMERGKKVTVVKYRYKLDKESSIKIFCFNLIEM